MDYGFNPQQTQQMDPNALIQQLMRMLRDTGSTGGLSAALRAYLGGFGDMNSYPGAIGGTTGNGGVTGNFGNVGGLTQNGVVGDI